MFNLCGCSKSKSKDTQKLSTQSTDTTQKVPDQLKSIEEGIEKIFKALEGPVGLNLEEESKKGQSTGSKSTQKQGQEEKSDSKQQSSPKPGGSEGESKQQPQQSPQPQAQAQAKDPWQDVNKAIQELHTKWDEYAPMSIKSGASKELTDQFGTALNDLTMTALKKDGISTMLSANKLYGYIPDFNYLYKTQVSPEIKKVKYYARDCVLSSMKLNWAQTDEDIKNLKTSFNVFKRSLDEKNKEKGTKIENSIYELEKVEKERNKELTDIKGRLVLKGAMTLEKEMDESSKK
jgi:hypothetical protein